MVGPRVSLEQWRALVAVVEAGSYARAAEALHKTQSTVSHAVQRLEQALEVRAFEIEGRRAVLTPMGRMLYRRGRALVDEALRLERAAAELAAGWEPELRLAVEIIFPTWCLLEVMARFADERPTTRIELYESVLGGTEELLLEGRVDLAVASRVPPGFLGDPIMRVRFIAAAAPSHPLHRLQRTLTDDDLRRYRHLMVRDTGSRRTRGAAWQGAESRWTVSNKATSIRAARMGLGFAWYAEESIREELKSGALRPLPLTRGGERYAELYLVFADPDAAGPGARRFAELLRGAVADCSGIAGVEASSG
jgi:DNA-binding transcriptional LysR family regulator